MTCYIMLCMNTYLLIFKINNILQPKILYEFYKNNSTLYNIDFIVIVFRDATRLPKQVK